MIESSAGSMKQGGWKFSVLMAAAALVQGLFWAVLVPPWQAPDEPSHFAYVQHLYESGTWTPPGRGRPFSMELTRSLRLLHADEIHHDPNCTFAFTPEESRSVKAAVSRPPPASRTLPGEGENGAGHYPPLYYWAGKAGYGVFAKEDVVHRLFGVRLVSVLFFALAVFFSALAVRELAGGDGPTARTAACFVLLLPMHGFIGSSANCDALLFSVSALLVLACARLLRRGGGWRVHLGIAAVIALGCITKPTFVPMAILWPLAALPHLFVRDEGTKEARRRRVTTLVFMGAALALLLFLYLRFGRIYIRFFEDSFARSATQENRSLTAYLTRTLLDLARPWTKTGKRFYGSYFADFGWMDTSFPFAVYLGAWICAAMGILRAALLLRRGKKALLPGDGPLLRFALLGAALQFFAVVLMGYVMAHHYSWGSSGLQGRYIFPALALHGVILAIGLVGSWRTERARIRAARITVFLLLFWQFASFARVFARYYC